MGKRKPTAFDRDLADYIVKLPIGVTHIQVHQDDYRSLYKKEGGMIVLSDTRVIRIVPNTP